MQIKYEELNKLEQNDRIEFITVHKYIEDKYAPGFLGIILVSLGSLVIGIVASLFILANPHMENLYPVMKLASMFISLALILLLLDVIISVLLYLIRESKLKKLHEMFFQKVPKKREKFK